MQWRDENIINERNKENTRKKIDERMKRKKRKWKEKGGP